MKYQVNIFYSLQVEATSEAEAEEKAGEYMESEEGQGVRLSDMSIEVEEVGSEPESRGTCGNCSRPIMHKCSGGCNK